MTSERRLSQHDRVAVTRHGAIATPHALATQAGVEAYRRGGNALDAALAAATAIPAVYPHMSHVGGDSVSLVRTPDGVVRCVNSTGFAPRGQRLERLAMTYGAELPLRGPDVITVPGAVRGWEAIRGFGAALPWSAQFDDAIRFAAEGVPVAPGLARSIARLRDLLGERVGTREIFLPGGSPLTERDTLRQAALADTYRALASSDARTLYGGAVGRSLAEGLQAEGSVLTLDDLATFSTEIAEPLSTTFRGDEVLTSPPNTQGFILLRALNALAALGDPDGALGEQAGSLARVFDRGNRLRESVLADPRFADVDVRALLHDGLLDDVNGVNLSAAPVSDPRVATGDTVGIAAVDADGYAISHIQSLYNGFGSGVLEPRTGILMQNRGAQFSLDPASPNRIEPGKRPSHTLMPVMVLRGGEPAFVTATMGGKGQPQIHTQVLLRLLDGASPDEAVSAPRWLVGAAEPGDPENAVYAEEDVSADALLSLAAHGLPVTTMSSRSDAAGHAHAIAVRPGGLIAASDPRADGAASVVDLDS